MLDFSGNIIGRNKEGNEFLGKLKKSLAQKAKHEYKQKVISNLDRRRNNIVDSINAKITESQQTHHEKVVSNNLDHPLVSLEDQMQILDKQHLNRKKQLVLENHIKIINESFERFSDNLAEVQSKLIRHSQKSFDKKTVLALIYELQEISNQFSSVLEIVENAPRLDLAQIESGIRPDNDLLIDIQTKITEEVDRIFNKRIEYIPEKVKKILINKKELERLTKNQQLQDEIKTRIIKILLENDDNFTNVEILKASLDYLFSLKEEAEVTKDNIILEAEEILQESHLHLFWKKIFEICDNSFSAQDKRQLKENFEIFKKSLKDSIGVHKQKMAEIKKYTSVDIIKEKKELEEAVLELEKIDREYSIWMNKLLLEIDWQHRKISDMEKDNIQKVNGLLVEEIRRSLN
jgi:hypothetical protein